MMKISRKFCFLILLTAFGSVICLAQKEPDKKIIQNQSKFNLFVTDKDGGFVTDLKKEDFSFFIDGKEFTEFSLEKETKPLLYMLAMDNSGSMRTVFGDVINTAKTIIGQNKPEDLTALMRFVGRDKIQTTDKFSADKDYLYKNLDLFKVEAGQTAAIDAIYNGVNLIATQKGGGENFRRVFLIISDGEDRDSANSQEQLLKLLNENDVQVFFIGLINELDNDGGLVTRSPRKAAKNFIEKITEESGGVAVFPRKTEDLQKTAEQLPEVMRTQYVVKIPRIENLGGRKIEIKTAKSSKHKDLTFYYRINSTK